MDVALIVNERVDTTLGWEDSGIMCQLGFPSEYP